MVKFVEKNSNAFSRNTTDCVIRALTIASGKDYFEVADELYERFKTNGYMPDDKKNYEGWLKDNGFVKCKQPVRPNGRRFRIFELDEIVKNETVVISTREHLTVIVNRTLYDTFDCRDFTVGNYYIKK